MATNGDLPSDDESVPGSPPFEGADGATQEIEEEDQGAAKPKSALKKTTKAEIATQPAIKPELPQQRDHNTFDVTELTPLSHEIISRQATVSKVTCTSITDRYTYVFQVNIGTIGHVAHGKSTVVKAISGVQTVRFKNELERNITIKLGYANAKIYKCDNEDCPRPTCYKRMSPVYPSLADVLTSLRCPKCDGSCSAM